MEVINRYLGAIAAVSVLLATGIMGEAGELENYTVSWVGNTYPGGNKGWVPQDVQDIFVTPDGTVYTNVGWEEHRGNVAAFRDGRLVQQTAHWRKGGIDRLAGKTITANDSHIFFATSEGKDVARRPRSEIANRDAEKRVAIGSEIRGLVTTEAHVTAACADGKVRQYTAESLEQVSEWSVPNPGEMALSQNGVLWIIQRASHEILSYSGSGEKGAASISPPEGIIPRDIAFTHDNRLLVADFGVREQVRIYTDMASTPRLERTFGIKGGVYAGEDPGRFGDRRFLALVGVGSDAAGNIYVASGPYRNAHGGTAIIQSYTPEGELNWRVMSTEWLDVVDFDRTADGRELYGKQYRYSKHYDGAPGDQWALEAVTVHRHEYPDDPRLEEAHRGGVWHRELDGTDYLFFPDMNGGKLFILRFDPEDEGKIAVPCGRITAEEIWIDSDANGREEESEVVAQETGSTRGWHVDRDGAIWQATLGRGILKYPIEGYAEGEVPEYSADKRRHYPQPEPFTELRRIRYRPRSDTLYLGGSTEEHPADHWKPMGPNVVRYDDWHGERLQAWHRTMPHEPSSSPHESFEPFDMTIAGNYLFVVYAGELPSRNLPRGTVRVYAKEDGSYVGHMEPSGTRTGKVPMDALQDIVHSINAYQRPSGEYLVVIEDDGYTKNVIYTWRP